MALAVNNEGYREVLGVKCVGLVEALGEVFPEVAFQRCIAHFYRNMFTSVPKNKVKDVAVMLKAIHAQEEDIESAREKAGSVVQKLRSMKQSEAAAKLEKGIEETLSYMHFPREHWTRIRTNNGLERIMREFRRRTGVVGLFSDGHSALMLVSACL